jgi:hypothetical protein
MVLCIYEYEDCVCPSLLLFRRGPALPPKLARCPVSARPSRLLVHSLHTARVCVLAVSNLLNHKPLRTTGRPQNLCSCDILNNFTSKGEFCTIPFAVSLKLCRPECSVERFCMDITSRGYINGNHTYLVFRANVSIYC